MGRALAKGLLLTGEQEAGDITVSNPHLEKLEDLAKEGINVTTSNREAAKDCDVLFFAVKPWLVKAVAEEVFEDLDKNIKEICFIVAGIKSESLYNMIPSAYKGKACIGMPNTAMSKGKSMTFLVEIKPIGVNSEAEPALTKEIFSKVGDVKVIEERLLPAATALASCGIAYAMRYVRAATEGGVELGFRASEAQAIVTQTLAGAVELLKEPGSHAEAEIDKVTTPGGLTIKGLNAMEREGFTNAVVTGLKASVTHLATKDLDR